MVLFDPMAVRFRRYIVDTFVISSHVLSSEKQVIINSLDVSGASASSYIEFTDLLGILLQQLYQKKSNVSGSIVFKRWFICPVE